MKLKYLLWIFIYLTNNLTILFVSTNHFSFLSLQLLSNLVRLQKWSTIPQNPDIVLVHYLNVPYPDDNKMAVITPSLALWGDKKEWTKEELVCQLKPMCKITIYPLFFLPFCHTLVFLFNFLSSHN